MKQRIINTLGSRTRLFSSPLKYQILLMFSVIVLFLCPLFLRNRTQGKTGFSQVVADSSVTTIPSISSTKWWIKPTATTSPSTLLTLNVTKVATDTSARNCSLGFSSTLEVGIYAYISLVPPLPNRVRAGAGKANAYLGQIQPGAGVRIIDGPLCADGFSWWLVEAVEGRLRGWTVEGRKSEQWVVPCPNPTVACKKTPVIPQVTQAADPSSTQDNYHDTCTSEQFSIGMITQVEQENLLVIRSEPYIGSVLGHAGPMSVVQVTDGPSCAGGVLWWKVNVASLNLNGWAAEANLRACSKKDGCT
jgi:hypothetical protein